MKKTLLQPKIKGFTLVELLATLAIMAIIAGALFPFIGKYTQNATDTTNFRSLKMLQDSVDRYMSLNPNTPSWVATAANANTTNTNRTVMNNDDVNSMITNISAAGEFQTLRAVSPALTASNVIAFVEGKTNDRTAVVYIVRYRAKTGTEDRFVTRQGPPGDVNANWSNGISTNANAATNL